MRDRAINEMPPAQDDCAARGSADEDAHRMNRNFVHRSTCELCGSGHRESLLSVPFGDPRVWNFLAEYYQGRLPRAAVEGADYELAKCRNCGFVWQAYVLNDELMAQLYSNWISPTDSLDKKQHGDVSLFKEYAEQARWISYLIGRKPCEIAVLDFGMGWGYWCVMANAFGYNVQGFEVDRDRIDFAASRQVDVINDYESLCRGEFDFINAEQVFEHITEPLRTLKDLGATLRSGGVIRIAVPDGRKDLKRAAQPDWAAAKDALHPLEHINCFTPETLRSLGKSAGLKVVECPYPLVTENRGETLLHCLRRVTRGRRSRGTCLYFRKEG